MIFSGVFFISFTVRYVMGGHKRLSLLDLLLIFEMFIIYAIGGIDKGRSYVIFYYCIGTQVVLMKGKWRGLLFFLLSYGLSTLGLFSNMNGETTWRITLRAIYDISGFMAVYIGSLMLRYVIVKNDELNKVTRELKLRTFEQQETYEKLLKANKKLEELVVMKERNRIAREIHDTIGHRLTTAIVEMEAGKTIFPNQKQGALDKFMMAKEQVKQCLQEVRTSVRALKGEEISDFDRAVLQLVEDTERHTGVKIKYEIEPINKSISQNIMKTLYRIIQEGITNGIRHGESTLFVITLSSYENFINLIVQDNGKGCSCIVKGFGLQSMEERVEEVNGTFSIESEEEGFTIKVQIPINV